MKKLITVLLTAMLLIASSAYAAGTLEDADKAYRNGNEAEYIKILKPLALNGNAQAQFELGDAIGCGAYGLVKDSVEAARLFRLAAEKGHTKAQFYLGDIYKEGRGVVQDFAEAAKWYKLAAAQGHADAQVSLADMYKNGQGVIKNLVKAHMWYNLAEANIDDGFWRRKEGRRDELAEEMTQQQIAEAQKLARECLARKYKGC